MAPLVERRDDLRVGGGSRLAGLIVTTLAVGVCALSPLASPQSREFGRTIAAITVGQDRLDRVRSLYGSGAQTTVTGVQSLCYYVEQDQSYLSVSTFERESRVRSVMLTTFTYATPGCQDARITARHLTASRGIALGDPMSKIIDALGQPAETGTVRIGEHDLLVLDYLVSGGRVTCQFEHNKLVTIGVEFD